MADSTSKTISIRIAIDIPVDVAAETLQQLAPVLARLQAPAQPSARQLDAIDDDAAQVQDKEEALRAEIRAHYDEQRREFVRKAVQAYRLYRRIAPQYEKPSEVHRVIARKFEWPVGVVPSFLADRRKKVAAYLKKRQLATVLRLAREGYTNNRIADAISVSQPTVNRLLKQARAADKAQGEGK